MIFFGQKKFFGKTHQELFQAQGTTSTFAPEINLIPFIDVLLVILIFLMISTTFTKYQELSITLPTAEGASSKSRPKDIMISISSDGRLAMDSKRVSIEQLNESFQSISAASSDKQATIIIAADGKTSHQSVMQVMEAARNHGLSQIVFATQSEKKSSSK